MKGLKVKRQMQEAAKRVQCQQFFSSRQRSQYFKMRQPKKRQAGEAQSTAIDGEALWAQIRDKVTSKWAEVKKKAWTTIQKEEKDKVNPWLERTQWQPYLVRLKRSNLMACIKEPNTDPKKDEELIEAAI